MKTKKQSKKVDLKDKSSVMKIIISTIVAIALVICATALIKNASDINRLKSQLSESQEKYNQQVEENSSLKAILDSEDKAGYMEDKAREDDYVKDGEVVLYDVG